MNFIRSFLCPFRNENAIPFLFLIPDQDVIPFKFQRIGLHFIHNMLNLVYRKR